MVEMAETVDAPFGIRSLSGSASFVRFLKSAPLDSKSQYVGLFLGKALFSHLLISLTRMLISENSSDIAMGRRPESKSEELIEISIFVGEIISIQVEIARRLGVHIFGF